MACAKILLISSAVGRYYKSDPSVQGGISIPVLYGIPEMFIVLSNCTVRNPKHCHYAGHFPMGRWHRLNHLNSVQEWSDCYTAMRAPDI